MPVFMGGSGIAYWLLHDRVDTTARHIAVIDLLDIIDFLGPPIGNEPCNICKTDTDEDVDQAGSHDGESIHEVIHNKTPLFTSVINFNLLGLRGCLLFWFKTPAIQVVFYLPRPPGPRPRTLPAADLIFAGADLMPPCLAKVDDLYLELLRTVDPVVP